MILTFTDATLETGGGKAANLGELQRAGLPVPDGFVITAGTYRQVVEGLDVASLLTGGAARVREAVESQPMPGDLVEAITAHLGDLGDGVPVAVRSSATAEDLPDASFAGQQDTFLGITGSTDVVDAVRRCWGSLWTDRAVDYRERNGFEHHDVALAVVVQRLVDADVAGVLFTQNPLTGADEALINASWGLGESVVCGAVTPDEYRATRAEILDRTIGTKQTRIDRHGSGTITTDVPTPDQGRLCLSDHHVHDLVHLGQQVTDHFGRPMDIEWAIADGQLWLLQARPITTSAPHATPAATPRPVTTVTGRRIGKASTAFHNDLVEHYPGPYPLDVAAIIPLHRQLQAGMDSIGIHSTPIDQLISIDDDGTITAGYPDVRLGRRLARLINYPAPDPAGWPAVDQRYRQRIAAVIPEHLDDASDDDLFTHLDAALTLVNEIARVRFLDYVGPTQLVGARLDAYLRLARRRDLDAYDLLGDLDYTTAIIDRELTTLASLDPTSDDFTTARHRFLDQFGARTTKLYLPFSNRSWRENPAALDATLEAMRRAPHDQRPPATPHAATLAQIRRRLPSFARPRFDTDLAAWRAGHVAREASVYLIEETYLQARRVTDQMARRLVDRDALTHTDDLKYLTLEQVHHALTSELPPEHTQALATRRATARPKAASRWWANTTPNPTHDLTGIAGSPGTATGPARIITGPDDFHRLQPGDILVCQYTDPSWTPLFTLAAGIVADTGGRLSHAAIVAREYAIPAIMGTHTATTTLHDGHLITINGTTGSITT